MSGTAAEYLSDEELRRLAGVLAGRADVAPSGFPSLFDFVDRLAAEQRTITAVCRSARDASAAGETLTPAAEWLLDNLPLIEENLRQVARDLPPTFYRRLPAGMGADDPRAPRALVLAWLCIAHSNGAFVEARLTGVIEAFQQREPLRIGELWALPSVLRAVLLVHLMRLALLIERGRTERRRANALADVRWRSESAVIRFV